jgi:hypothetical protein
MAQIQITDKNGDSTTVDLRDDYPLTQGKLIRLASQTSAFIHEIQVPIDETKLVDISFQADYSTPDASVGGTASLSAVTNASVNVSIALPEDKTLFPGDQFTPEIAIKPTECWIGIGLNASVDASAQATVEGFGIGVDGTADVGLTTYTKIESTGGKFPALIDGLKTALDGVHLASSTAALRNLRAGIVCANEISGSVTLAGSYELPVSVNALASANLPFEYAIKVQPEVTLGLSGSVAVSGDLIVRTYKISDTALCLGVYKKKGTTLNASFTAAAGVELDNDSANLANKILAKIFPDVDCTAAKIGGDDTAAVDSALKASIDHSFSISVNGSCSAVYSDEAAAIYQVDLSAGNTEATDAALKTALQGDWTPLSRLENAKQIRSVVVDAKEYKRGLTINLFGLYNFAAIDTYLQSSTILCDEHGHLSVTDETNASRIRVATTPYAADADKVRIALAQDFLVTASYSVIASRVQPVISIQQSYFFYDHKMSQQAMRDQVLIGAALGLIGDGGERQFWNQALATNPVFAEARIFASAKYDADKALSLFFADAGLRQPRTRAQIEQIGRDTMIALIDAGDPGGSQRRMALDSDSIWNAMDSNGNVNAFVTIPQLSRLPTTALGAIEADWTAIRWWADAMLNVAPKLAELLALLDTISPDGFSANPQFTEKVKAFRSVLGDFLKKTHASFVGGWGIAVVFALAGSNSNRAMDISWSGMTKHYESSGAAVVNQVV